MHEPPTPRTVARHCSKLVNPHSVMLLRSAYWAHHGYHSRAAPGRVSANSITSIAKAISIKRIVMSSARPLLAMFLRRAYARNKARACPIPAEWPLLSFHCVAHVLVGEPASTPDQVRGRLSPGHAL